MSINCEYSSACFASNERKTSTKSDRKSMEISSNLQSIIENLIVQDTFPGSQVDVYVELIQDDGGSYAACKASLRKIDNFVSNLCQNIQLKIQVSMQRH